MDVGKAMRLGRLFRQGSGRSVIVAVDHGRGGEPEGLENLECVLEAVVEAGADALLLGPGAFIRYHRLLAGTGVGVVIAADMRFTSTYRGGEYMGEAHHAAVNLEECAAMGVDAVKVLYVFGQEDVRSHARNARLLAELVSQSWRWGVPVMVETVLWGPKVRERQTDGELLRHAARAGWEAGADLLKMALPGDRRVFASITARAPVPILVLGGPSAQRAVSVLEMAQDACAAGASGVVFGRNVWQHRDPAAMVRALCAVVHEGQSAAEAAREAALE